MSDLRWERVKEAFNAAMAALPEERAAALDRICAGDAELRREVESLVQVRTISLLRTEHGLPEGGGEDRLDTSASGTVATRMGTVTERAGEQIGPYKLLQVIGEGGFGTVFMAEQEKPLRRRVALKVIKLGMDTRSVIARFEAERQALAMMDHPHIARVLDAGATASGRPYFVMELVRGEPITVYADRQNLSIAERIELVEQVCHAAQHAHTKGVIHRDIKPSNVLVGMQDGKAHAKVIDFGIAKATEQRLTEKTLFTEHRALIGTPEYMSPEQAEGSNDLDTRTDVYSLGVLLYELLAGSPPFDAKALRGAGYAEIQRIIREVEPPKPSTRIGESAELLTSLASHRQSEPRRLGMLVRGELDWIVMRAMDKDRARRYESASALAADLRRHLEGEAVVAAPPTARYLARKFVRRNRGAVIAAGVLLTALVLGVLVASAGLVQANIANGRLREQRSKLSQGLGEVMAELDPGLPGSVLGSNDPRGEDVTERETIAGLVRVAKENIRERRAKEAALEAQAKAAQGGLAEVIGMIGQIAPGESLDGELGEKVKRATAGAAGEQIEAMVEAAAFLTGFIRAAQDSLKAERDSAVAAREAESLERRRAEAVNRVLQAAMELSSPERGGRRDVGVAEAVLKTIAGMGAITVPGAAAQPPREAGAAPRPEDPAAVLADQPRVLAELCVMVGEVMNTSERGTDCIMLATQALGLLGVDPKQTIGEGGVAVGVDGKPLVDDALTARAMDLYGSALSWFKPDEEASPWHRSALAMRQRLFPGDHPAVAESLASMGWNASGLERWEEAFDWQVQALGMRRRLFRGDHVLVAISLQDAADAHWSTGSVEESLDLYREALAMRERLFGKEHESTAYLYKSIADCLEEMEKSEEAKVAREIEARIRERALNGDSETTAQKLALDAKALTGLGKYDAADEKFRDALAMWDRLDVGDREEIVRCRESYASTLISLNRSEEGVEQWRTAWAIRNRLGMPENPRMIDLLVVVVSGRIDRGEAPAALALQREVVAMAQRLFGTSPRPETATEAWRPGDHATIAFQLQWLASALGESGNRGEAISAAREAVRMCSGCVGADHADTADARRLLAWHLFNDGKVEAGLEELRQVVALSERLAGKDHETVADAKWDFARMLDTAERFEEADAAYQSSVEMKARLAGGGPLKLAALWDGVALDLEQRGRIERSIAARRRALAERERIEAPDRPRAEIADARRFIAMRLNSLDRREEALAEARIALSELDGMIASGTYADRCETLIVIARCLESLRRQDEAIAAHRAVRDERIRLCAEDPDCMGRAELEAGEAIMMIKSSEALGHLRAAVDRLSTDRASVDSDSLRPLRRLGNCLYALDQREEALRHFRTALARADSVWGPSNGDSQELHAEIADCLWMLGRNAEALAEARTALKLAEELFPAEDDRRTRAADSVIAIERTIAGAAPASLGGPTPAATAPATEGPASIVPKSPPTVPLPEPAAPLPAPPVRSPPPADPG